MSSLIKNISIFLMTTFFLLKCSRDESNETTGEILLQIIKTESQLRDEEYKADSIYGKIRNLDDYWIAFKTIGETQYGYDFGEQEVEIFTDLTIASSDSNRDDAAGIAHGSCKEGIIKIAINADYWAEYSHNRRLILCGTNLGMTFLMQHMFQMKEQ